MQISRISEYGHDFLRVKNNRNLEIELGSFGASVFYIKYKDRCVTYHPDSVVELLSSKKYYGKTLGRVAGRLKDGTISLDGHTYQLDKNENGNTLHGGFKNLSFVDWTREVNENDEDINVVFKYTSKDGECGFPGEVRFIVIYSICKNKDRFTIHYHAVPDRKTPINMSSHIYWRLSGNDILDHKLFINANEKTVVDPKTLVTVGKEDITEYFDFRKAREIGTDIKKVALAEPIANGYDHGWIFNKCSEPQIILSNGNLRLYVNTDMSMVNIYANCHANGGKIRDYGDDITYGGIAIEPQMFFTSFNDLLCSPEEPFDKYFSFTLEEIR